MAITIRIKKMKDLFSDSSALYHQARPTYPHQVIEEILNHVTSRQFAWDCGAGSGQFTQLVAPYFEQVVATDLSSQQLHQAPYFDNVSYQVQQAEQTSFADQSFDLITVAQAIHWFNFDAFYGEVQRTLKKDGVLAVVGYGLVQTGDTELNGLIDHLYRDVLGEYWDIERKHIDHSYQCIPFPFEEQASPELLMQLSWSAAQFVGYLNTWTGLKHHRTQNAADDYVDPLTAIIDYLENKNAYIDIHFPVFLRIGKLKSKQNKQSYVRHETKIISIFKRVSLGLKQCMVA